MIQRLSWFRILAFFLCGIAASRVAFAASLTIASWNLEVLSEVPWFEAQHGIGVSRNRSDFAAIARFLYLRSPDVVLLQELAGPRSAEVVFGSSEYDWYIASSGHLGTDGNDIELRNGIGIRKSAPILVRRVEEVPDTSFPYDGGWTRAALALEVESNGSIFTLVNVHLKAGCQTPISTTSFQNSRSKVCVTLRKQVGALAKWVRAKVSQGERLLVAGDFNRYLQAEFGVVANAKVGVRDAVLEALVSKPLDVRILPAFSRTSCATRIADAATFLDYFVLFGADRGAEISNFAEFPYPDAELASGVVYSNHCYISVTLTTR